MLRVGPEGAPGDEPLAAEPRRGARPELGDGNAGSVSLVGLEDLLPPATSSATFLGDPSETFTSSLPFTTTSCDTVTDESSVSILAIDASRDAAC